MASELVRPLGLEPRTNGLKVHCSTIELEARDRQNKWEKIPEICCQVDRAVSLPVAGVPDRRVFDHPNVQRVGSGRDDATASPFPGCQEARGGA